MLRIRFLLATLLLLFWQRRCWAFEEEHWGDGLQVLTTFLPDRCEHRAQTNDVIHYHYIGRLAENSNVFGRSFDYDSPYIVALGQGRIIAGMDRGLANICLWERRRITIPPHLGYGERGVGQVIPPNSTLVFYVRLIKIERNGSSLGEERSIEELWKAGLASYGERRWQETVDVMEEALRLFEQYENKTSYCLRMCRDEGSEVRLSRKERETAESYSNGDPLVEHFLTYAARSKCIRECKTRSLSPSLQSPENAILRLFRTRIPYSYLHYAYYQVGNIEEGAKCLFTYYFHHPTDEMALSNFPYYRKQLELGEGEFVSREPGVTPHQAAYLSAKLAYEEGHWLESTNQFERALALYPDALDQCQLMCEDILIVNMTQEDLSSQKKAKFDEYSLFPDMMEYHQLMVTIVREVLECRVGCHTQMATINGEFTENFPSNHFNYLQFAYYKLEHIAEATEAAATYRAWHPSDATMADNIRYYTFQYKLEQDAFVPRQEFVDIHNKLEVEQKLLHLAKYGEAKKKEGKRGDDASSNHEEL